MTTPSDRDAFQDIIDADVDGLLDTPEKPTAITSSDRLERAFLEIVDFYRQHQRIPSSTTREIAERKLGARLDGILADDEKSAALAHLDEFGLLAEPEPPASIDDILDGGDLGLLDDESGILDTSGLPARRSPVDDFTIARRTKAIDFETFEPLFKSKHAELGQGLLRLIPFPGVQTIAEGAFFVLNGVMLFVAEVGETERRVVGGKEEQKQRLRVIFENGTESGLYRQSLSIRLHEQAGFAVVPTGHDLEEIGDADVESGHVYVLRSLSDDPQIQGIENLFKIGFSTSTVEQRTAGAASDPTYLMAPIEVVADYRVYNVKASALERLLHRVFAETRLDITQIDVHGRRYDPSEWFIAPLDIIDQAISMIMSGEIVDYFYDPASGRLLNRR